MAGISPQEMGRGMADLIPLGKTDIHISRLGLGTWQWGDRMMWGYGKTYTDSDLHDAFQISRKSASASSIPPKFMERGGRSNC